MSGNVYLAEFSKYLYNWRLFLTPKESPDGWDFAWCYAELVTLTLAVPAWDMDVEDEPAGWIKRPTYNNVRRAPRRDPNAPIRCIHGCLPGERCDFVGCPHA